MSKLKKSAGAGAIAVACAYIMPWEGLWTTAKIDTIGTGRPVTVCYGATKAELPNLKVGDKFTQEQCAELLKKGLPKYWDGISKCLHVELPDEMKAALISAAYNAGSGAVCKSPMIARFNDGDQTGGCNAFAGWYVRAQGRVVPGLINRRNGEKALCLEGLNKPAPAPTSLWESFLQILKGFINALH